MFSAGQRLVPRSLSSGVVSTLVVQDNIRCAKFFQVCKLSLFKITFSFLGCATEHQVCKSTLGVRHLNNYNIRRFNNISLLSNSWKLKCNNYHCTCKHFNNFNITWFNIILLSNNWKLKCNNYQCTCNIFLTGKLLHRKRAGLFFLLIFRNTEQRCFNSLRN